MNRRYPIYKLADDLYCEWISACDAPGRFFNRADVAAVFADEILEAEAALDCARNAMARLDKKNHTMIDRCPASPRELVSYNRAGVDECRLSYDEIVLIGRERIAGRMS